MKNYRVHKDWTWKKVSHKKLEIKNIIGMIPIYRVAGWETNSELYQVSYKKKIYIYMRKQAKVVCPKNRTSKPIKKEKPNLIGYNI
jgi:hypothetical protein